VRRTKHLLTVEEGTLTLGWGAEIAAQAAGQVSNLKVRRAAALDLPIGNAKTLEDAILPSLDKILQLARELKK
jgi:pyruvate/2-oxoglutarate/acetoin dehydrogenase E1 component